MKGSSLYKPIDLSINWLNPCEEWWDYVYAYADDNPERPESAIIGKLSLTETITEPYYVLHSFLSWAENQPGWYNPIGQVLDLDTETVLVDAPPWPVLITENNPASKHARRRLWEKHYGKSV